MIEGKDYWQNKKIFLNKYSEFFSPYIKTRNEKIKKTVKSYNLYKKLKQIFFIFACCLIFLFFPCIVFLNPDIINSYIFIFFPFLLFAIALFMTNIESKRKTADSDLKALKILIKNELMPKFCQCFEDLNWTCGKYDEINVLSMGEFSRLDETSIKIDDVFKGLNNGIKFDIIEIYNAKRKCIGEDFNGWDSICIRIKTDKKFSSNTYIVPKNKIKNNLQSKMNNIFTTVNVLIGKLCGLDSKELDMLKSNFHFTNFEDVNFEKKFDVYTDNELEARYLITPAFMEKVVNIEKKFNAKIQRVEFCFGSELLVFLKTKEDSFELFATDGKSSNLDAAFNIFDEMVSIFNLIDYVKKYLVFEVEAQNKISEAEKTIMTNIFLKALSAKEVVSKVLMVLSTIFSIILSLVYLISRSYRNVYSKFAQKLHLICTLIFVIVFLILAFVYALKRQLDRQINRYDYLIRDENPAGFM